MGLSNHCRLVGGQIAAREPRDAAETLIPISMFSRLKPLTLALRINRFNLRVESGINLQLKLVDIALGEGLFVLIFMLYIFFN